MYTVQLKKSANKSLQKIDSRFHDRILRALQSLETNPFQGKPLKGEFDGYFTLRIWPYRIIYKVYEHQLVVFVIRIDHRQGVYK